MLVLVVAGVVAASASALRFDDGAPCPDNHPIFLCPSGAVGQPYSIQLVGAGGCGPALPYQYKILNGALPGGLSLSSSGVISGVPTGAGTSDFWVELSDENPPSQSWCRPETAQREFNITIQPGLRINQNSVPGATIGQAYSQTLTASDVSTLNPPSGPQVNATWSVHSGTLPPGVALSTGGVLSGTPTTEGSYQFVVQAVNGGTSDTETYTIVVRQPVVVAFTATPPKSEVGVPFEAALKASGGSGTYTWALAGGSLPTGVNFDTSTGQISGSPSVPGRFAFSVSATDSEGRVTTFDATLVVAPKLSFKTVTLKAAKVGKLYEATIKALGGVSPVKWKILGGKLPRGIRFEKSLGTFSGTPSTKLFLGKPKRVRSLKFRVAVQATDALGVSSKQTFVLVVNA
jgi:hypothetical protein